MNKDTFIKDWMEGKVSLEELQELKTDPEYKETIAELEHIMESSSHLAPPKKKSKAQAWSEIADQLEALNRERQAIETQMLEEAVAEAQAEMESVTPPSMLLTHSEEWHPGIVGLLASRLKDRFRRPAIAIAFDRNGKGSGSCRSLAGVDIGAAVRKAVAEGVLVKGGGHAMAAGLTQANRGEAQ